MPKLYYLVGLPGAGKGDFAEFLSAETGADIFSINEVREYCHSIGINNENKVYNRFEKAAALRLSQGFDIIVTGTNVKSCGRRHFLKSIAKNCGDIEVTKICYIVATPAKICIDNSEKDKRQYVDKCRRDFETPEFAEGWGEINVYYPRPEYMGLYKTPREYIVNTWSFDQECDHTHTLGEHCGLVYRALKETSRETELTLAAAIHDCGKPITKTRKDGKVLYYHHHHVGAYEALFFDCGECDILYVSALVCYHMAPFFWNSQNAVDNFIDKHGKEFYDDILKLHREDKKAK